MVEFLATYLFDHPTHLNDFYDRSENSTAQSWTLPPVRGNRYTETPLWAGIYLLPLTAAFLISGPISGYLSDRFGARGFAHRRHATCSERLRRADAATRRLSLLGVRVADHDERDRRGPVQLSQLGIDHGRRSRPGAVGAPPAECGRPPEHGHGAVDRSVLLVLDRRHRLQGLPAQLLAGLQQHGVSPAIAHHVAGLPPVSSLFAALLGDNPIGHLLGPTGALSSLPAAQQHVLTGTEFFPRLIASAFHDGLVVVFSVAAGLSVLAAAASLMRGGRYVHTEAARRRPPPLPHDLEGTHAA